MLRLKNIYLVCPLQKKTTQPITFVTVNLIQQIFLSGFIHPSVYLDPTKILVTYPIFVLSYAISHLPLVPSINDANSGFTLELFFHFTFFEHSHV